MMRPLLIGLVSTLGVIGHQAWGEPMTFVLGEGSDAPTVSGEIIQANSAVAVLRLDGGGALTLPNGKIVSIIASVDGREVQGEFVGWTDGVYAMTSEGQTLNFRDGQLLSADPGSKIAATPESETLIAPASQQTPPPPPPPDITVVPNDDPEQSGPTM